LASTEELINLNHSAMKSQ